MLRIYCDYCVDIFDPVEYYSVDYDGLNFCSDACHHAWVRREEVDND